MMFRSWGLLQDQQPLPNVFIKGLSFSFLATYKNKTHIKHSNLLHLVPFKVCPCLVYRSVVCYTVFLPRSCPFVHYMCVLGVLLLSVVSVVALFQCSAFPPRRCYISFLSSPLFPVFSQPMSSFPVCSDFSIHFPHLCFSTTLHLHLIPTLVWLYLSPAFCWVISWISMILLFSILEPFFVFPWCFFVVACSLCCRDW